MDCVSKFSEQSDGIIFFSCPEGRHKSLLEQNEAPAEDDADIRLISGQNKQRNRFLYVPLPPR